MGRERSIASPAAEPVARASAPAPVAVSSAPAHTVAPARRVAPAVRTGLPPGAGNAAVARAAKAGDPKVSLSTPAAPKAVATAMKVSAVTDPHEVEAEAVAARIVSSARAGQLSGGAPGVAREAKAVDAVPPGPVGVPRSAADAVLAPIGDGVPVASRAEAPGSGQGGQPVGPAGGQVPDEVRSFLADPGTGAPLSTAVAGPLATAFGADLSGVRVHTDEAAQKAAARLGARAFTIGNDIWLGAGESPADLALLAHEVTHVVQQRAVPVTEAAAPSAPQTAPQAAAPAPALSREADVARVPVVAGEGDVARAPDVAPEVAVSREAAAPAAEAGPGAILSAIGHELADLARHVPGYTLLTVVAGYDPISCEAVPRTPERLLTGLLDLVPFGSDIVARMRESELIGSVAATIEGGLVAHNLTKERFLHEVSQTWDEMSLLKGIDGNLAVLGKHLAGVMRDVMGFAEQMVTEVLALIRKAAVGLAEKALLSPQIEPTWRLATKVFHHDPLRDVAVEAPTAEILGDFLHLGGRDEVLGQLKERGALQKAADWIDTQLARFGALFSEAVTLFTDAWAAIQPSTLAHLGETITSLAQRAFALVGKIVSFVTDILAKVLELVKEALLGWLSKIAHGTRGFPLLTVVLGQDPFTGTPVPRNAENLIKGFICLMPGGEATYAKLAESGVIAQAGAKIEGEMQRLGISIDMITNTFLGIWNSLSLQDLLDPIGAFGRVLEKFAEPLQRLVSFIGTVVGVVVDLILRLMNFPSDLIGNIINNTLSAIEKIEDDPVGFLMHLLEALKTGVMSFLAHIGTHLAQGLTSWLTRGLGSVGVKVPEDLSLKSVLGLVIDVLGLSVETLWSKLGDAIGKEKVDAIRKGAAMLGDAWSFVVAVESEGLSAIWKFLADKLSGLWDGLLAAAENWVLTEIVEAAAAKLLSMLDPTGIMAVINSFVAFFRAVQSAIDYLRDILAIVDQYVSTIAAIAAGNIAPGAAKLEAALASGIPVAIGFLAAQVGLSNVPEKLVELIKGLRELVDEALTWLVQQAVRLGGKALEALGVGGKEDPAPPPGVDPAPGTAPPAAPAPPGSPDDLVPLEPVDEPFKVYGQNHRIYVDPSGTLTVASDPRPVDKVLADVAKIKEVYTTLAAAKQAGGRAPRGKATELKNLIKAIKTELTQREDFWKLLTESPKTGHAPNIGRVASYSVNAADKKWRPQSKEGGNDPSWLPMWEMEAEHLIPRAFVNAMFEALDLPEVSSGEYNGFPTILLYAGASKAKTYGTDADPYGDNKGARDALKDALAKGPGETADGAPAPVDPAAVMMHVTRLFGAYIHQAASRTEEAVKGEDLLRGDKGVHPTMTNGEIRGEGPRPAWSDINRAYMDQAARAATTSVDAILRLRLRAAGRL